MNIHDIPVITVSYNSPELIRNLLTSVRRFYPNPYYIIDGSEPGPLAAIREVAKACLLVYEGSTSETKIGALNAGLASGAHMTLIPEQPYDVEEVCRLVKQRFQRGASHFICVVAEGANAIALSFAAGKPVSTNTASTFADGMAVRVVNPEAFAHIHKGVDRIVTVNDDEIADAVRLYFRCCHTVAEGAGAAPLAALMQERDRMKGKRVGVILSGGNIDMPKFAEVLDGRTPTA